MVKIIDGKSIFKGGERNIQKNRDKIENEVRFLLRIKGSPYFVQMEDYNFEDVNLDMDKGSL